MEPDNDAPDLIAPDDAAMDAIADGERKVSFVDDLNGIVGDPVEDDDADEIDSVDDDGGDDKADAAADEDDAEDDADAPANAEEDELEIEGAKVRGAKAAIEKLRAAQAQAIEYQTKAEALQQHQQAIEQQQQQIAFHKQFEQGNLDLMADIRALEQELSSYSKLDLRALNSQDPVLAQRRMIEMNQLRGYYDNACAALNQRQQQFQQAYEGHLNAQAAAEQQELEQEIGVLRKSIPDWNEQTARKVLEHALSIGVKKATLDNMKDSKLIALLHADYKATLAKNTANAAIKQAIDADKRKPPPKPPTNINSGSKAKASRDLSRLPMKEYMKARGYVQ